METGEHRSKHRVWTGTLVIGENGGDVCVNWNGWVTVERELVGSYPPGVGVQEAATGREQRRVALEGKGWRVVSERGEEYRWDGKE